MTEPSAAKPIEKRRLQQREETRRAILDATEALLVAEGYEAFSMRRLADQCGYTAPSIYHHFGDKRGLIDALLEERFLLLVERMRGVAADGDPLDTLRRQLLAFVRFGLENPTHYRLLMVPRLDEQSPPPRSSEAARELIEVTLQRLARRRRLQVADIEAAVQCIWTTLHGLISLHISRPDHPWVPNHVELALGTLLRGLVSPAAAPDRGAPATGPSR
jgi:AcrR family transcriptional regulator